MSTNIICNPPLGQITLIPFDRHVVHFNVLWTSDIPFPQHGSEVVLWHNSHESGAWRGSLFNEVNIDQASDLSCRSSNGQIHKSRRFFVFSLSKTLSAVRFTLKFRISPSDPWKWVNDQIQLQDGELVFQPQPLPQNLSAYLQGLSSKLDIHAASSETPETLLWSITASVTSAEEDASGYSDISLGTPCNVARYFCLIRASNSWLAPRHGRGDFALAEDAVLCSFLRSDGIQFVILAVSGLSDVLTVIKSDDNGNIIFAARNDALHEESAIVLAAAGKSIDAASAAVMYHARKLLCGNQYLSTLSENGLNASIKAGMKAQWMENWYDGLTYCTWNGLGQNLSDHKIYDALDKLDRHGIKITNLIIDDNWQSIDKCTGSQYERGWLDFEARRTGFPQGLKHTITTIREKHRNIEHIAVWHAILGYWGGIAPAGDIAAKYKTRKVRLSGRPVKGTMLIIDPGDAQSLFNEFYQWLLDAGVDSVKADVHGFLDMIDDANDRRDILMAYQDAWIINTLRYFSGKAIASMSQAPQMIFHTLLPTNRTRLIARNSDDFFPEVPASHPWHVFANAHNSVLTAYLNVLPDWDMFQTSHPYASFHAAGRCVSGGPICITDEPGKHDVDLIAQITARTTQGKSVILRPSVVGKATSVYTSYHDERLLKIGTYSGGKGSGTSILGLFNVSQQRLAELVSLTEFPGVEDGEEYIIRAHCTGRLSKQMRLGDYHAVASLTLETMGWEIFSAYPLYSYVAPKGLGSAAAVVKVAVLGLVGKMTGAAAVLRADIREEETGGLRMSIGLKALGVLGIYVSDLATRSIADSLLVTMVQQVIPLHTVHADVTNAVLEINIEQAWREMQLEGGWSNELPVDISLR